MTAYYETFNKFPIVHEKDRNIPVSFPIVPPITRIVHDLWPYVYLSLLFSS